MALDIQIFDLIISTRAYLPKNINGLNLYQSLSIVVKKIIRIITKKS